VDFNVLLEAINEILGKDIKMLKNVTNVQKQRLLKEWAKNLVEAHTHKHVLINFMTYIVHNSKVMGFIDHFHKDLSGLNIIVG
jgi:hypothetical protein